MDALVFDVVPVDAWGVVGIVLVCAVVLLFVIWFVLRFVVKVPRE